MSFFGWLTKSKLEVTMLDELVMFGEILTLLIFIPVVIAAHNTMKSALRSLRKQ